MVRHAYINKQVLNLYSSFQTISFPINPKEAIKHIPNCKYMSYQKLAKLTGKSTDDIVRLCESKSGCTHYDVLKNRYLILCNQSNEFGNNRGRQLWTCAHEIGHVVCGHHTISAYDKLSENNTLKSVNPAFESEADYFAATFLAPFPLFQTLSIKSPIDIQNIFGLSSEASLYRFKRYLHWRESRIKTAWENDLIRLYREKSL